MMATPRRKLQYCGHVRRSQGGRRRRQFTALSDAELADELAKAAKSIGVDIPEIAAWQRLGPHTTEHVCYRLAGLPSREGFESMKPRVHYPRRRRGGWWAPAARGQQTAGLSRQRAILEPFVKAFVNLAMLEGRDIAIEARLRWSDFERLSRPGGRVSLVALRPAVGHAAHHLPP